MNGQTPVASIPLRDCR